MADKSDRTDDPIRIEELPKEGNSNARIYPPADKDDAGDAREEVGRAERVGEASP